MDGPGDRARRVIAYGLDLDGMCKDALGQYENAIKANGLWPRFLNMPQWEKVELLLGLYECAYWKVEVPDSTRTERALWYVAREMNCFHKNVLEDAND